jgi:hypothetical protein
MEKADPDLAFARPVNPLVQPSGASLPVSFSGCGVRPMWRTLISMTGASAERESAGWLAEEGAGGECVAAFFAMPAV